MIRGAAETTFFRFSVMNGSMFCRMLLSIEKLEAGWFFRGEDKSADFADGRRFFKEKIGRRFETNNTISRLDFVLYGELRVDVYLIVRRGNLSDREFLNSFGGVDLSNVMRQTRFRRTWAWHSKSPWFEVRV